MKLNSIQVKTVSLIVFVLLIMIAVVLYIALGNQRRNLLEAARNTLSINTEMLNSVIQNIMLSGEAPIAQRTLASLRGIEEFREVSIYRIDGTLAFSDYMTVDFVNRYQDSVSFERTPRLDRQMLSNEAFQKVLETNAPLSTELTETQEMEYFFPILNYRECRVCHGETNFIRGIAHFNISISGIFRQIREAGTLLTYVFAGTGLVIALLLIFIIRRLIIRPVFRIGEAVAIVGDGNLDTRIDLQSGDELGQLGDKINDMILGLKETESLRVQNEIVEAANRENRKYLDNIKEGLALIDRDFRISEQFSVFLIDLFGTRDIAGKNFVDFIFPDAGEYEEERSDLTEFLTLLFSNTTSDIEMFMDVNPLKDRTLRIRDDDGEAREIVINGLFHRIVENDEVANTMVIFEDRTNIVRTQRELEIERKRSEEEIEQIAAILKAGPQAFVDFVEEADNALNDLQANWEGLSDKRIINRLFRAMHSLKGTARYLGFRHVSDLSHQIEDRLAKVRDEEKEVDEEMQSFVQSTIEELTRNLDDIKSLNDRFRSFSDVSSTEDQEKGAFDRFAGTLGQMVQEIAGELVKKAELRTENTVGTIPFLRALKNPVIHLIRNALDHGVEDTFERVANHKSETGRITVSVNGDKDNNILIKVSDDGRGIDFDAVRKKAVEKKLIDGSDKTINRAALLNLLFTPSFSSKEEATEISGRGVGLDVVRDVAGSLGGHISVSTKKGAGTTVIMKIPVPETS